MIKTEVSEDTELKQAFVNLLFQYSFENINRNIPAPKAVTNAKKEYLDDVDTVKLFLDECVSVAGKEQDNLKTRELFDVFRNLFEGRCEDMMTITEFSQSCERHGIFKTKSGGVMYARKIKWNSFDDNNKFLTDAA